MPREVWSVQTTEPINMSVDILPTEIFLKIFKNINAKKLITYRQVCLRWKNIIDEYLYNDRIWYKICKDDYPSIFKIAKDNAIQETSWYNICKSLHLWSKLQKAKENIVELRSDSLKGKEIRDFKVLRNGIIGVHSLLSIIYFDLKTMECSNVRPPIQGNYVTYMENDHLIVLMSPFMHLFIIIIGPGRCNVKNQFCANDVIMFLLVDKCVYYITQDNKLYVYNLDSDIFKTYYIYMFTAGVVTIGFTDQLNILTHEQHIYSLLEDNKIHRCKFEYNFNILHELWRYKLLERMDWKVYMQWMYVIDYIIPHSCLNVSLVRPYGDIVFVGKPFGILEIYYKPFINDQFNIWKSKPIKSYDLAAFDDCEEIGLAQIQHVEVIETENSHLVLVGMTCSIVRLKIFHIF